MTIKSSKLRYIQHVHEDIYETTDIDYAVVLKALGYELVNIFVDHKRKDKVVFVFKEEIIGNIISDLKEYVNDELRLNPRELLNRFRDIKNLSHDVRITSNKKNSRA